MRRRRRQWRWRRVWWWSRRQQHQCFHPSWWQPTECTCEPNLHSRALGEYAAHQLSPRLTALCAAHHAYARTVLPPACRRSTRTHTHTYTHMRTHTCAHTHTHTYTQTHTNTDTRHKRTRTDKHTHTCTHTHTHAQTNTHTHTHTHVYCRQCDLRRGVVDPAPKFSGSARCPTEVLVLSVGVHRHHLNT
jgi:hypothetical protein